MVSETGQLIAKIIGYVFLAFILYLFYKFYYKKENKIAKPWIIFSWILGIFFTLIGIGNLLFMAVSLIVPSIPIRWELILLNILGITIFGTLGIILILVARGKWGPKHIK